MALWPMTRGELAAEGRRGLWDGLFATPVDAWPGLLEASALEEADWRARAAMGGYPVPAHELEDTADRQEWFQGYVRTYLERDLRDLAAIDQLEDFSRLMRVASLRVGGLVNQADLARDAHLSPATAHRYLNLLETSFQLVRVAPYASSRTKRLTKSPKAFWSGHRPRPSPRPRGTLRRASGEPRGAVVAGLVGLPVRDGAGGGVAG